MRLCCKRIASFISFDLAGKSSGMAMLFCEPILDDGGFRIALVDVFLFIMVSEEMPDGRGGKVPLVSDLDTI